MKKLTNKNIFQIYAKYLDLVEKLCKSKYGSKTYLKINEKIKSIDVFYSKQTFGNKNHCFLECFEKFITENL